MIEDDKVPRLIIKYFFFVKENILRRIQKKCAVKVLKLTTYKIFKAC